jgi:hypothetical protein
MNASKKICRLVYGYFILPAIIFIVLPGCNLNNKADHHRAVFTNAVSYNEYIISRQSELIDDADMVNLASQHDYPLALKMLDTLLVHSTQNLADLQMLAPFRGDSSFKETAIDLFNYYNNKFVPYSRKMLLIKLKIDSGTAMDSDYKVYDEYAAKIGRQSPPIEKRLVEMQARFARKNNFLLKKEVKN